MINSDFVELQIDYLEELGLHVDNLRFVRQENCDDGIGRLDCEAEVTDEAIGEICSFDFESFIADIALASPRQFMMTGTMVLALRRQALRSQAQQVM